MNIPNLILVKRANLKESQKEFGLRFGVSHVAVSDWENGKSEAPYRVIEFVQNEIKFRVNCPVCKGRGFIE